MANVQIQPKIGLSADCFLIFLLHNLNMKKTGQKTVFFITQNYLTFEEDLL